MDEPGLHVAYKNGYALAKILPATGELAGVMQQLYTHGLFVGITEIGYDKRYCYENGGDAALALALWDGNGDPPGPWIKLKASGEERLGPGATG